MPYNRPEYLEEDSKFVQKIETDSNICNNCFRKVREHSEAMHDSVGSITEYEDHADFAYFDDFVHTGRPSIEKAYCECGAVDWNEFRIRPLSVEEMKQCGQRIINHLMEKGFVLDEETFFTIIEDEGPLPENQYKEEEVFEKAVSQSLCTDDSNDDSENGDSKNTIVV